MTTYLEISLRPEWVRPAPVRLFCIRADATFRELRDAILVLTGWEPTEKVWSFTFGMPDCSEIRIWPRPERLRGKGPGRDPEVTRLHEFLDPDVIERRMVRYYHDFGGPWRVDVLALGRWELLDDRRRWLSLAVDPWPPFGIDGAKEYARLLQGVRSWSDPDGLVSYAREVLHWSPELDVQALEERFERR
jgi:hypothetical protein